mgnify:CR=1 FL=1
MRVFHLERRAAQRFDVIDRAPGDEIQTDGIHHQLHTVGQRHGVIAFRRIGEGELVLKAGTAAAFHSAGSADSFEGPAQFVAAYHAALPLTDAEQEVVAGPAGQPVEAGRADEHVVAGAAVDAGVAEPAHAQLA